MAFYLYHDEVHGPTQELVAVVNDDITFEIEDELTETLGEDKAEKTSQDIFSTILAVERKHPRNPVERTHVRENNTTYSMTIIDGESAYATLLDDGTHRILARGDSLDELMHDLDGQLKKSVLFRPIRGMRTRQITNMAKNQFSRFPMNAEFLSEDISALFDKPTTLTSMTDGV